MVPTCRLPACLASLPACLACLPGLPAFSTWLTQFAHPSVCRFLSCCPRRAQWLNYYIGHKDYVDPRVVHLRDEVGANEAALRAMRSFVPANIWRMDKRQLAASGLAPQLVDRIWTNRALWLIRATRQRWLKGIDVKLLKRTGPGSFDISSLDHVEVRAIYLSIPSDLGPDNGGYRRAYRESVLERAYGDAKCPEAQRPRSKKRHALYVEAGERGPFDPDAPNEEFEAEVVGLGADKSVEEIKAERAAELERIRQAKARDRGEQVGGGKEGGGTEEPPGCGHHLLGVACTG